MKLNSLDNGRTLNNTAHGTIPRQRPKAPPTLLTGVPRGCPVDGRTPHKATQRNRLHYGRTRHPPFSLAFCVIHEADSILERRRTLEQAYPLLTLALALPMEHTSVRGSKMKMILTLDILSTSHQSSTGIVVGFSIKLSFVFAGFASRDF